MACAIVRHIQMMNEVIQAAEAIRIHCVVAQRNMLDSRFDVCAVSQGRFTPAYVRVKSQEFWDTDKAKWPFMTRVKNTDMLVKWKTVTDISRCQCTI